MRNFKLRITRVDSDGFCGREHHPSRSDEGLLVSVVRMFHEGRTMAADAGYSRADLDEQLDYFVWECVTDDGRTLELIGHEVEIEFEEDR